MTDQNAITILGLGPGRAELLTRQAWQVLEGAREIYLRTREHPIVNDLPQGVEVHSFDEFYEKYDDFEEVYEHIVAEVLELGRRPEGVIYAVPGNPFVAEAAVPEIVRRARAKGIPVRLISGLSFIDAVFEALEVDVLPSAHIVDAFELVSAHHTPFPPDAPALIAQVYSTMMAAQIKITLMAVYPDEHQVKLVHNAGADNQTVESLPLHEIDKSDAIGPFTSLYVPTLGENTSFEAFQELIAHLRAPEGCPWDREQTHQSLRPNLLEEAYETLSAIDADDPVAMQEEFGDLLLQVVLQTQIASEYGEFKMSDVIHGIHTKLVDRHPHVFGEERIEDAEGVKQNWERIKAGERHAKGESKNGLLEGIPDSLPALAQADAYQKRAARVGFDWPDITGVLDKIEEEIAEIRRAGDNLSEAEEIGDLLFALANLARWKNIDPESALRATNNKFRRRFAYIETQAEKQGRELSDMTLEEMDAIWDEAKDNGS
ncbi:MAG: nucleoside triphosphate pyrophosphohydrolase [Anaerolineae bacterium]|nr:nucleoside triphosphate pyrophosphohydrolase [Anaerolineae bacterium]